MDKFAHAPCPTCGTPRAVVNHAWLRTRRKASGVTARAFAASMGVSGAYICDIEKGRRRCSPKMREAYESLADVSQGAVPES